MGHHTFDVEMADALDDPSRYEHLSAAELVGAAALAADDRVLDVGSGTGFYTDTVAGVADRVHAVDVAVSTMTYHELPAAALDELARVVRPGGRLVVADWTASGPGEAGPPPAERFDAWTAAAAVDDAGFTVRRAESRVETFLLTAVR